MTKWAALQPKDGEIVMHCGHVDFSDSHWAHLAEGPTIRCKDGVERKIDWLVACDDCYRKANGHWGHIPFRETADWKGNDPIIKAGGEQ